jgi:hypothetical protein
VQNHININAGGDVPIDVNNAQQKFAEDHGYTSWQQVLDDPVLAGQASLFNAVLSQATSNPDLTPGEWTSNVIGALYGGLPGWDTYGPSFTEGLTHASNYAQFQWFWSPEEVQAKLGGIGQNQWGDLSGGGSSPSPHPYERAVPTGSR